MNVPLRMVFANPVTIILTLNDIGYVCNPKIRIYVLYVLLHVRTCILTLQTKLINIIVNIITVCNM